MPPRTNPLKTGEEKLTFYLKVTSIVHSGIWIEMYQLESYLALTTRFPICLRQVRVCGQQPPSDVCPNIHVIRQPTGPDGTSGFRLCR